MKKFLSILIAGIVLLAPVTLFGAAVTTDSVHYLGSGVRMFKLSGVSDTDTFVVNGPIKGWSISGTDTGDSAIAGVSHSVSGSVNTLTIYLQNGAVTDKTANLFIYK